MFLVTVRYLKQSVHKVRGYFQHECTLQIEPRLFKTNEITFLRESPRGVVANVLDCGIVETEFEHQLRYYVYFLERHEPSYSPS